MGDGNDCFAGAVLSVRVPSSGGVVAGRASGCLPPTMRNDFKGPKSDIVTSFHFADATKPAKSFWDTYKNDNKPYSSQISNLCALYLLYLPLKQCCLVHETIEIVV